MKKRYIVAIVFVLSVLVFTATNTIVVPAFKKDRNIKYYSLSDPELILKKGPEGAFDSQRTHTMSIAELNKDGYRFWAYYHGFDGKNIRNDMGVAYSNDLTNWVKEGTTPVIPNLRWGTVVVVDGIVHMFGTRNYGGNSYIVRLSSEDGKNFKEEEVAVAPAQGERHQNPFIFYDEKQETYRLYYYHFEEDKYYIEEKHAKDIKQIGKAEVNKVLSDTKFILAAPSMMYRDGKYWLAAETLHQVNGKDVWKTIVFVSRHPYKGFVPVDNHEVLVNNDACYFQHIFDNRLIGVYSHESNDGTWEMYKRTHDFATKNRIMLSEKKSSLSSGKSKQLTATVSFSDGTEKDMTASTTWASSDNQVASVVKGQVTAKKPGKAIITASYGGSSTTEEIEVK